MKILGYVYRIVSNFAFLALVYYSLNFMEKYNQRAIVAILLPIPRDSDGGEAHAGVFPFSQG